MRIINVVGARPNFIKIAPLISEMQKYPALIEPFLLHTGQHYDKEMSEEIFKDLELPNPEIYLGVGSDSYAKQIGEIMSRFEKVLKKLSADLVLVVGDVNSTLACALIANKLSIPVAHIEAGLRSFNWQMPEEINRVLTDHLSDYLFITERSAYRNLIKEGISKSKIYFVGNVMIDTLRRYLDKSENSKILKELNLKEKSYAVLTLHRPENVDNKETLFHLLEIIKKVQKDIPIVLPLHPRTKQRIKEFCLEGKIKELNNLILTKAMSYLDFLNLQSKASFILTDSGGIQEEAAILKIPCLTLRSETERPVTVIQGSNTIVGLDSKKITEEIKSILNNRKRKFKIPEKWDGKASERIIKILIKDFKNGKI